MQQTQGKADICRCAADTRKNRYLQMCNRHKEKQISADVQQAQENVAPGETRTLRSIRF